MLDKLIAFLTKHKERAAIIGVITVFCLLIGGGLYLQGKKRAGEERQVEKIPRVVEISPDQTVEGRSARSPQSSAGIYALKPSADELLDLLASLEGLKPEAQQARLQELRVLWPLYFFRFDMVGEQRARVVFDVAEDGFGVVVESEVDTRLHPLAVQLVSGDKVWVGGAVVTVDLRGTGTVYLDLDHLGPGDQPPPVGSGQPTGD